jgi:aspartyl/asparaginyl beta-hydroxylase (cupin superfamily)
MAKHEGFGSPTRRFIIRTGWKIIQALEKLIAKYSLVGNDTFLDPGQFEWIPKLEANWLMIRRELEEVLKYRDELPNFQDISIDQSRLSPDNKWKTYFLYGFGYRSDKNCERCPETTKLIEQVPGMKSALFSILAPHKHIPEHRGPYKGLLRYHLGLIVPEPKTACRIRVGNDFANWEEGKSIIFDDTYMHEVWNDTEGERAVLFMDVVRPLRFPVSVLNKFIIWLVSLSAYVQDARKFHEAWEKRFDQIVAHS